MSRVLRLGRNISSAPAHPQLFLPISSRPTSFPLTTSQVPNYNQKVASLREATLSGNFEHISSILLDLRSKEQLGFLPIAQYNDVAAIVANQCSNVGPMDARVLEVAEICATRGAPAGLAAWMSWAISRGHSKRALDVYRRLASVASQGPASTDSSPVDPSSSSSSPLTPPAVQPKDGHVYFLLAAIASCAKYGKFLEAVELASSSPLRLTREAVDSFVVRSLSQDDGLRKKFLEYVHDLQAARLVARPEALARHILKLAKDSNVTSLYDQWLKIKEGFGGRRWLSASPADAHKRVVISETSWASFLSGFLRLSRKDYATEVWEFMATNNVPISEKIWNAILDGYCHFGSVDDTFAVWKQMQDAGYEPDLHSYASLLSLLCRKKNSERAEHLFNALFEHPGHARSQLIYHCNIMLDGLARAQRIQEALKLLERMREHGPPPDLVSYNTILRYYQNRGDLAGLAGGIRALISEGLEPDIVTFTTLVSGLYKVSRENLAQKTLEAMESFGITANTTTLTAVIHSLSMRGHAQGISAALDLLMKMESSQQHVHPNEFTYLHVITGLLRCLEISDSETETTIIELQTRMRRRKVHMSRPSYETLIKVSLSCGRPSGADYALKYFRDQKRRGLPLSPKTGQRLLKGVMRLRGRDSVQDTLEEMEGETFIHQGGNMPVK
ncbi:hypothetical protein SISSUDRAFT_1041166, partial [Sistotremastrum suecicum HHB10207 ss-3]